ncbi:MAG TPA: transposase [Phycisphaerae bacterium]|nr:transposase [Phycisphaerae bacterium]
MPRVGRIVIPGCPHHITQRGNNRQDVFFVDDDRRAYLAILKDRAERECLSVDGYCLMDNHVHLIATPERADSIAKAVGRTNFLYTQYVNRLHARSGHLWQNRFYSCALDDEHFWAAMAYVERNPVRSKIIRRAWRYAWSSAAAHCGASDKSELLDLGEWRKLLDVAAWKDTLCDPTDDDDLVRLRLNTSRGRPLGSDSFVSKLERALGRRLRPLPVGRPKKKNK